MSEITVGTFTTKSFPTWCPGCGDFGILTALKHALADLQIPPHMVALASGIGCSSKLPHWLETYGFHSIHGRSVPVATGIRLANHKLHVIAIAGDGDLYGLGMGHFIHALRRNLNITLIVHDNQIYGLTKGQTSPTSDKGFHSKSTPFGVIEPKINPIALALAADATFVARGFAGDIKHLTWVMEEAIKHEGFAFIDVAQPCVTFNHLNTYQWFRERIYKLEEENGYDKGNKEMAFVKALEWGEKIPIGVFFQKRMPTYEEQLPQLADGPLAESRIEDIDISSALDEHT
ncbi:2-oxoacid:ferredoxin oxidoreductase subunit beta [Candidatus Woesearchaeota archaeon]|nr:MAG: 2-oxoacid:ferredoxin oxidoreductase subunit beta [Candidatus Woesearchaeota archaeon]